MVFGLQVAFGWVGTRFGGLPRPAPQWLRNVAVITLLAFVEEAIFRQLLMSALLPHFGLDVAAAVSAIAFGIAHTANVGRRQRLIVGVEAVLAGLWFAYAFGRTESLALVTGLHAGWNLFMWQVFGYPETAPKLGFEGFFETRAARPGLLSGGDYGPEASLPTIVVDVVWVIGLRVFG